jgi:predicted HTH transcriptional regulator
MIVIPTAKRRQYLDTLKKCDAAVGKEPYKGANAAVEQIKPLTDFISYYVEKKMIFAIQFAKALINDISETDIEDQKNPVENENVSINVSIREKILEIIGQMPDVTVKQLAKMLSITERTVYRNINRLKTEQKIARNGSNKTGKWLILN